MLFLDAPSSPKLQVICDVDSLPRALALSVAWFTETPDSGVIKGLLHVAKAPVDPGKVFSGTSSE